MVALVILSYNNSEATRQCIESILRYNTAEVKFVVVDNGSTSEDRSKLISDLKTIFADRLKISNDKDEALPLDYANLLLLDQNTGYARGNNAGLDLVYADADTDAVMILNNDILFVEDIIPGLYRLMRETNDCAIISPVLYKKELTEYDLDCARKNTTVSSLVRHNLLHYMRRILKIGKYDVDRQNYILLNTDRESGIIPIELPSGSCMLVDKDYFKHIGSFDPNTFLYSEENILYKKISKTERQNYLSLDFKCIHLGASTTSVMPNNEWLVTQAKNSELYYVKNYSGASAFIRLLHKWSVSFFMTTYRLQKSLKKK